MRKRTIIIVLLILPYFPIGGWLVFRYAAFQYREHQIQMLESQRRAEVRWVASFRRASPLLEKFYLTMPHICESWSRTTHKNIFRYFAFSKVSNDLLVDVAQTFEVTPTKMRPLGKPVYYRENILDDYDGFDAHTLKTTSTYLTPAAFNELYRKYRDSRPSHRGHDRIENLQGDPPGWND